MSETATDNRSNPNGIMALFRYVEAAQRDGLAMTTAYGAYRKAGGTTSASYFRTLWRLAKRNPWRRYMPK